MSVPFPLDSDEGIILNDEDSFVLTNKRIVEVEVGLFGNVRNLKETQLYKIKVVNGEPQVFLTKGSGFTEIEVYTFEGTCLTYEFSNRARARQWADAISNILVGHPSAQAADAMQAYETAHAKTGLDALFSSAGDFAGAVGAKLSSAAQNMLDEPAGANVGETVPVRGTAPIFTTPSATVVTDSVEPPESPEPANPAPASPAAPAEAVAATQEPESRRPEPQRSGDGQAAPGAQKPGSSLSEDESAAAEAESASGGRGESAAAEAESASAAPRAASIDEQITLVKGLKELLDDGVLTQEEFDRKKREVMGL